jgi:hypothetical protein
MTIYSDGVSSNHPVRPRQHVRGDRDTYLFGSFQIDHQFELCRLLDGKFGGLSAF